jgi:hypothetical protein
MKLTHKLFILILFVAPITYAQDWIKTDITDFASINFPVTSELIETQRETVFSAQDEFAFYIVGVRRFTDEQSSRITKEEIPELYEGFVNGTIEAINGEIKSKNRITIQGMPALELEYYAPANPQLPSQRFKRVIYINQMMISIDFWPLTNEVQIINEKKARFFNSFLIQSSEVENTVIASNDTNYSETDRAFEVGFFVGQLVIYLMLIAFLIGVFLLVRYLIKRNRKKRPMTHSVDKSPAKPSKIICAKCDSENSSNTKYCNRCGFELPKN